MRRLNRSITTFLGLAVSIACGSSSSPLGPTPLPQDCRTYATQWTTTSTFSQSASYSASFKFDTHTYEVMSPAGSPQPIRRVVYASTADFIDEPGAFGRVLSTRTESCPEDVPCGGNLAEVEIPSYDRQRRETAMSLQLNGATLITETYTAWDSAGRPTAGARTQPGICTAPIAFTYDESTRTMTLAPSGPPSGPLCIGLLFGTMRVYDANGDLIRESGSAGGTTTTTTRTIGATSHVCK